MLIQPDRTPTPCARHSGEEWIFVVSGTLRLECDAETQQLGRGQSAHFDAERPHRLGAERGAAEVLLVAAHTHHDLRQAHR